MKNFIELGTEIGELVDQKNAAYGSSFAKAGAFLALLYPEGLRPEQYTDALLLVRIFDKQMRIATDRDALGESPYADIAGYGLLGAHMHWQRKEERATWQGSVNDPAAAKPSPSQPDSAEQSTEARTTPSVSAPPESGASPKPGSSCFPFLDVSAQTVTKPADPSVDVPHLQPGSGVWCWEGNREINPSLHWKLHTRGPEVFCSMSHLNAFREARRR